MNKVLETLKKPPKWLIVVTFCLTIVFSSASIVLLVLGLGNQIYAYVIYALAAVFLSYAVYLFIILTPYMRNGCIKFLNKFDFTRRIYQNYGFRTTIFSSITLLLNIGFGIFELVMGIATFSIWYGALGCYHLILSFTRLGIVLREIKESKRKANENVHISKKLKTYRNTGICIILTDIALIGAIVQMMFSNRAFTYAGVMIYVVSAYAFWKLTLSILGMVKAKNYKDYATQSFRNLNLTDALISLFALQTALIATFGDGTQNMNVMNLFTGVAVMLSTIGLGIYMIVKSCKERKKINDKRAEELKSNM